MFNVANAIKEVYSFYGYKVSKGETGPEDSDHQ